MARLRHRLLWKFRLRRFFPLVFGILGGLSVWLIPNAPSAQTVDTNSSFTDKIESRETPEDPAAMAAIAGVVSDAETLLKQNLLLQEQVKAISESLIKASQEDEAAKSENRELKIRIEALGINAVGNDRSKLEQRLIKAVSDLNSSNNSVAEYRKLMASLTESVLTLLKTSEGIPAESRAGVEAQLRNANQKLAGEVEFAEKAQPTATTLTSARIISLKPELGLLVGNVGSREGVKVGMPFRVYQGQKVIALARVVDVRDEIFGALIQEKLSDTIPVKVGYRLKVAAE